MKILQINCVYGYGSTGLLTRALHRHLLSQSMGSLVCYGRGPETEETGVWKLCTEPYARANNLISQLRGLPYGGCFLSTGKLLRFLEQERPDVVHLHCINGHFLNVYRLVSRLKQRGIRIVVTLHGEFLYTGNCAHSVDCEKWRTGCGHCPRLRQATGSWLADRTAGSWRNMERAFRGIGDRLTVVSVSPWQRSRAEAAPILREGKHRTVLNGVGTNIFAYRPHLSVSREWVIFHATAMFRDDQDHLKGGWYVLELARRMERLPVRFVVAGKYRLRGAIPANVTLLGEIRDRGRLAEQYSSADLTLLTSRRETFSMVCAESLCCGTPVVGFEAGGPESIALPEYSRFVPWGDLEQLQAAVMAELETPRKDRAAIARQAEEVYGMERMLRAYEAIYQGA